eukprot:CAMPEP_0118907544 /NCGR_PEP_ID=MMETSP1166-20130328/10944_1 /TAXON_ID=1104430 /ORGANISM="Chrysoreinhardia sp, Strain CCMP3193" /LENGTH=1107 /DNA_ID=CAMNT_0006846915 /DNA_START=96 /DNA_END=3419 /DNA_ORIENTATION=+
MAHTRDKASLMYHMDEKWSAEQSLSYAREACPLAATERASSLPFGSYLLERLEAMAGKSKKAEKVGILFGGDFLERTRNESLYPALRLLLPGKERERPKYKFGTKKLASAYAKALHLEHSQKEEGKRLRYFASAASSEVRSDFGSAKLAEVVEFAVKPRVSANFREVATVKDANVYLDALAACGGKLGELASAIERSLATFSPREHKWLARIVLGELQIGLTEKPLLDGIHLSAYDKMNQCQNLEAVCAEVSKWLKDGTSDVSFRLQPGIPFSPMVAKSFSAGSFGLAKKLANLERSFQGSAFLVDEKMDGYRFLIHFSSSKSSSSSSKDGRIDFFSRNCKNHTRMYLPSFEKPLRKLFKGMRHAILDGEILAVNAVTGDALPFGGNVHAAINERKRRDFLSSSSKRRRRSASYADDDDDDDDDAHSEDDDPQSSATSETEEDLGGAAWAEELRRDRKENDQEVPADWNEDDALNARLQLVLFDFIAKDEEDLESKPLKYRRERLTELLGGRLDGEDCNRQGNVRRVVLCRNVYCDESLGTTLAQRKVRLTKIAKFFCDVVESNGEGVVAKKLESPYVIGEKSRTKNFWAKLKPEDGDEGIVDVLIVGGFWSQGQQKHRHGKMDSFLLAVKEKKGGDDKNDSRTKLVLIGKCGIGFAGADLTRIHDEIGAENWKDFADSGNAPLADWRPESNDDRPDRLVKDVTKSVVLEVSFGKLFSCTQYSSGWTMRFPKCHGVRCDKPWDSISTVADLHEAQTGKLVALEPLVTGGGGAQLPPGKQLLPGGAAAQADFVDSLLKNAGKKQGRGGRKRGRGAVAVAADGGANVVETRTLRRLRDKYAHVGPRPFDGLVFQVLDDVRWAPPHQKEGKKRRRKDLEKGLAAHGAEVVAAAQEDADNEYILATRDRDRARVQMERRLGERSVVDVAYVDACLEAKAALPLAPRFFLTPSRRHAAELREHYDTIWGVPLGSTVDAADLREARDSRARAKKVERAKRNPRFYDDPRAFLDDDDLEDDDKERDLVKKLILDDRRVPLGLILAPVKCFITDDSLAYLAPRLRYFGATLVDDRRAATHLLVPDRTDTKEPGVSIVDPAWLAACVAQRTLLESS